MVKRNDIRQPVAIFDFDGTITRKSTTLSYLRFVQGPSYLLKVARNTTTVVLYHLRFISIDALNQVIAYSFFKNLTFEYLNHKGAVFSKKILPPLVKQSALERIQWHKDQGHYCILATSAYDMYIRHWSDENLFDACVSTKIAFDEHAVATGKLDGKSCYGEEKLRRVIDVIGDRPREVYAYGDSSGDNAILDYATYPYYKLFK